MVANQLHHFHCCCHHQLQQLMLMPLKQELPIALEPNHYHRL